MNSISLTIPLEYNALTRASDMLHGMAIDLSKEGADTKTTGEVPSNSDAADTHLAYGDGELDVDGLPWDHRIHSSSKTQTLPGQWKKKRGVSGEKVVSVEEELRAAMAIPTPANDQVPANDPIAPPPPNATEPVKAAVINTLPELIQACTQAGKTPEEMTDAVMTVGLASVPLIAARPDLIPDVAKTLGLV